MKKIILVPLLIILFSFSKDEHECDLQPPPWRIVSTTIDPNLPKGYAEMRFVFQDSIGQPVHDSVKISYNGMHKTILTKSDGKGMLSVKKGKYRFTFELSNDQYIVWTDTIAANSCEVITMQVNFGPLEQPIYTFKPVIYVYPETTLAITVKLNVNGKLGFTYPAYNTGWNFTAEHDGTIHMNDKSYDYLFWDSENMLDYSKFNPHEGCVVSTDSLITFMEMQLTSMGLSPREQQDFITFWCPLMQQNESNYVHFMFNEEYDAIATLQITPAPNHIFRVFMLWSDAKDIDATKLHPQKIPVAIRDGFSIIEWGGAESKQIGAAL